MNSSQHNGMRMHPEDDFQLLGHESTPAAHQAIGSLALQCATATLPA